MGDPVDWVVALMLGTISTTGTGSSRIQGCGNTMPDLSNLVPFHSGQVKNFNLLVLGQVQNLYKVAKILYFIF